MHEYYDIDIIYLQSNHVIVSCFPQRFVYCGTMRANLCTTVTHWILLGMYINRSCNCISLP